MLQLKNHKVSRNFAEAAAQLQKGNSGVSYKIFN